MNIINHEKIKISIHKSGKGERFHLKPLPVSHMDSMANMKWVNGDQNCTDSYLATFFFVPHLVQIFWLWFIIAIEFKREKLSQERYVRYDATHYYAIEDALTKKP